MEPHFLPQPRRISFSLRSTETFQRDSVGLVRRGGLRTPERSDSEGEPNRRQVDWKFWVPIASALVGGASLIAGTFVSSTCTKYGPGEDGCIEYGFDLLGRGITVAGVILLFGGLYVIFAPPIRWPLFPPET